MVFPFFASIMIKTPISVEPVSRFAQLPFFYGWVVVGVAFVTMAIGVNARTAFSLLYPSILDEFGWTRGAVAGVFSLGFIASMAGAPIVGILLDRVGPRWVMPGSAIVTALGMVLATLSTEPWHFYIALGALVVVGSVGIAYIGHGILIPHWFDQKRGLALGIAFSGVGFGAIVLFPVLQIVIEGEGWRQVCWILAGLLLIVVVPLNILFQRRRPLDIGLRIDGETGGTSAASDRESDGADTVIDRAWVETDWTVVSAVQTTRFWWLGIGFFCGLFAWYAVQVHQTRYLIESGYDSTMAAFALGLVAFFGIVGQISIGYLSDRIGREWGWTISLSGFAICYLLLIVIGYYPSTPLLYLMVATQGAMGYGVASMLAAITMEVFQGRQFGTIFGCLNIMATLGAAAGPWLFGVIYDQFGSYDYAFSLAASLCVFGILCIWIAAPRKVRMVSGHTRRRQ